MKLAIGIYTSPVKEEAIVKTTESFDLSDKVMQLDILQDAIYELEKMYEKTLSVSKMMWEKERNGARDDSNSL